MTLQVVGVDVSSAADTGFHRPTGVPIEGGPHRGHGFGRSEPEDSRFTDGIEQHVRGRIGTAEEVVPRKVLNNVVQVLVVAALERQIHFVKQDLSDPLSGLCVHGALR